MNLVGLEKMCLDADFRLAVVEVYKLQKNYLKALRVLLTLKPQHWTSACELFKKDCSEDVFCLE